MNRIIFVPQHNVNLRYQEWWCYEFENQFKKYFDEVIVLGKDYLENNNDNDNINFSSVNKSIELECLQMKEYLDLELLENDILFMSDISFPGIFQSILFHKKPSKMFAYCHATSLNYLDIFSKDIEAKWCVESTFIDMMDGVFLGSKYHDRKLGLKPNTHVLNLPEPPLKRILTRTERHYDDDYIIDKCNDVVSVCRDSPQKIDYNIENKIKNKYNFIRKNDFDTWDDYYEFLNKSKCLLITSLEDTFNYTVIDAIKNNSIPIAPNKLCFPEILPKEYLYDDYEELEIILDKVLNNKLKVPELKCQGGIDNFYKNMCDIMRR